MNSSIENASSIQEMKDPYGKNFKSNFKYRGGDFTTEVKEDAREKNEVQHVAKVFVGEGPTMLSVELAREDAGAPREATLNFEYDGPNQYVVFEWTE